MSSVSSSSRGFPLRPCTKPPGKARPMITSGLPTTRPESPGPLCTEERQQPSVVACTVDVITRPVTRPSRVFLCLPRSSPKVSPQLCIPSGRIPPITRPKPEPVLTSGVTSRPQQRLQALSARLRPKPEACDHSAYFGQNPALRPRRLQQTL
jgi:hypothetical protein